MNAEVQNFINKTDQKILILLEIADGFSVEQIAEILSMERHTVTQSVALLCGMGLLKQNEPTYSLK